MKPTLAVLQVADCGPLESLVEMLQAIGIRCCLPNKYLRAQLRDLGCDTVLEIDDLVKNWGYDQPMELLECDSTAMMRADTIYVDVKAHRNGLLIWKKWPQIKDRTLWYRINGGKPEHVIRADGFDCGDEVNPSCPVITPNQWYKKQWIDDSDPQAAMAEVLDETPYEKYYAFWPPFHRINDYLHRRATNYYNPICLVHNWVGWGYGALKDALEGLGVSIHGRGSPAGLLNHSEIPALLSRTLAMVHAKSNDAPGYALYEALASACPVICSRRLIWRCRMQELLIPGKTCLVFDRETHDALSVQDVVNCKEEIKGHLKALHDPAYNALIGEAGRTRLQEIMWRKDRDADSLRQFIARNFS